MKVLDLKERLFRKALLEWVNSMDTVSSEDILIKVEEIILEREKKEKAS